jgi:hypothetical protein
MGSKAAPPGFHSGSVPYYHLNFLHNPPFLGIPMARGITVADTALQVHTHLQYRWPTILSSPCPIQPNDLPPELSATKRAWINALLIIIKIHWDPPPHRNFGYVLGY